VLRGTLMPVVPRLAALSKRSRSVEVDGAFGLVSVGGWKSGGCGCALMPEWRFRHLSANDTTPLSPRNEICGNQFLFYTDLERN
jgi:hypothetical protein